MLDEFCIEYVPILNPDVLRCSGEYARERRLCERRFRFDQTGDAALVSFITHRAEQLKIPPETLLTGSWENIAVDVETGSELTDHNATVVSWGASGSRRIDLVQHPLLQEYGVPDTAARYLAAKEKEKEKEKGGGSCTVMSLSNVKDELKGLIQHQWPDVCFHDTFEENHVEACTQHEAHQQQQEQQQQQQQQQQQHQQQQQQQQHQQQRRRQQQSQQRLSAPPDSPRFAANRYDIENYVEIETAVSGSRYLVLAQYYLSTNLVLAQY